MITAVFTLEKTGTDTWEYYTNPEKYLTDGYGYPVYCAALSEIMPCYCGDKAKELFPSVQVTFEPITLQKLLVHWEAPDSATIVAWWDNFTELDIHDCYYLLDSLEKIGKPYSANPGLIGVLQLLYPNDDISLRLEFTSVTEEFTKTQMYDYFKEHPYVSTPTMV